MRVLLEGQLQQRLPMLILARLPHRQTESTRYVTSENVQVLPERKLLARRQLLLEPQHQQLPMQILPPRQVLQDGQ